MVKVAIIGAGGRMGKQIAMEAISKGLQITAAIDIKGSPVEGKDLYALIGKENEGSVQISSDIMQCKNADVIIDFTGAKPTLSNLPFYKELKKPLVLGSTGFSLDEKKQVLALSEDIALLMASNMSTGVNVMLELTKLAAKMLKGYDIEIVETHHKMKKDAPSGTALSIAEAAAEASGIDLEKNGVYSRHGLIGERKPNEIGIQTLRGGDVAGDHTIFFFGDGERIEITHRANNRNPFSAGAVKAAIFLKDKPKGIYSMKEVLL